MFETLLVAIVCGLCRIHDYIECPGSQWIDGRPTSFCDLFWCRKPKPASKTTLPSHVFTVCLRQ